MLTLMFVCCGYVATIRTVQSNVSCYWGCAAFIIVEKRFDHLDCRSDFDVDSKGDEQEDDGL